ncbi:hypothetical protein SAMN05216353_102224 [Halobacillus alkaliphilus]|uniref:Uncharacterized protein n=1 Tax=Halobacillus alkaliphilus TaxID=396056 RepID=A0A1I2JW29_9BACI|nr:hypothetical protein [Halobacillus alkaliphilus]SFF59045.1 hypothetical protein SAMN05216353_102224 [Halobacillus alkaliphilus]
MSQHQQIYTQLLQEFEQKLDRQLKSKERELLYWIAENQAEEIENQTD